MYQPNLVNPDPQAAALILEMMPLSMMPVIEVVGLKSCLAFIKAFAGQVFVIPKSPRGPGVSRFLRIEQAIGIDAALQISKHFGGEKMEIPRMAMLLRKLRNREIIRDFDAALKVTSALNAANELATKYEMTWRQIEMIVNGKTEAKKNHGARTKTRATPSALRSQAHLSSHR